MKLAFGVIQFLLVRMMRAAPIFSGLAKVLLSYSQCIGALNRFALVRWPRLFVEFMAKMDVLVPEFFSVVPAECLAGTRFGFYIEFFTTFCMPILLIVGIAFVVLLVRVIGIRLKWPRRGGVQSPRGLRGFLHALNHPRLYHLMIMAMLVVYPSIARKTLALFDCMPAGQVEGVSVSLLRDDPGFICYDSQWQAWSILAWISFGMYCLGIPLLMLILARACCPCLKPNAVQHTTHCTPIPPYPPVHRPSSPPPFLRWRNVAAARKFACLDNGDVSR